MSQSKAKQLWDLFIEAECGSHEKSACCDIFLSQVLSDLHSGQSIQDILNFGNFSGIGTLIGCEILSDVHHQVLNVPSENEDLKSLQSYLFTKGWRCLAVLHSMGNVNLACSSELTKLLFSLYPLCFNKSNCDAIKGNLYLKLKPSVVQDIILPKTPAKIKLATSHSTLPLRAEYRRSVSYSSARSRRTLLRDMATEIGLNVSSDEPESGACALQTGGGLFKLDPMDFDYFTSVVRSDDEARLDSALYEPRRKPSRASRPHPCDLVDASINIVMESVVTPYEFSMLSIQLLTSLAKAEHTFPICPDYSYPTCTQCIKFSLENLCSLQFNSVSDSFTAEETVELKVSWTQLLVLCLEKVMGCPDVTCSVISAGILPMMLRTLEDVINKIDVDAKTNITVRLEEVGYGLLCGTIGFLHSLLMQGSDSESRKTFLEMVNRMIESGGGRLMDRTVYTLGGRSHKILDLLSQLVVAIKRRRMRLGPALAKKARNRHHKSPGDVYHHSDDFGTKASSPLPSSENDCCVSKLILVLIRLLQNSEKLPTDTTNLILKILTHCGICCCTPIQPPIVALAKLIKEADSKTVVLVCTLLEKTIYPQLGAYDVDDSTCKHCDSKNISETAWEKLEIFRTVALHNESNENPQGHAVICHLIRIAPEFRMPIKRIVLFKIFYPLFEQSKEEFLRTFSEYTQFLILSSLSLFASILHKEFVQKFIALKAVGQLLDLVYLTDLSKHCCLPLEKTILCELSVYSDIKEVSSLLMLQTTAEMVTDAFLANAGIQGRRQAMGKKRGLNQVKKANSAELLQLVAVFWRIYASLTLTSPSLREHFSQTTVLADCRILFNVVWSYFTKTQTHGLNVLEEDTLTVNCLPKLVESLLTFLLVTSPLYSDIKEKTMEKLTTTLRECDVTAVSVRKICQVLIKCSLARPNASSISENPNLPIMSVWTNWGQDASEKEQESELTCTDEDDYVTADEGYDADVELKSGLGFGAESYSTESESWSQAGKSSPAINHPELCELVIELLARVFSTERSKESWRHLEEMSVKILSRLTALCRDNPDNSAALCKKSVILSMLKGFEPCLSDAECSLNLRTAVLDLIAHLGKCSITSTELAEFLQFFKKDKPPLTELLKLLISLVSEQGPKPDFHLKFPILSPEDLDSSSEHFHRNQGALSCWNTCGVQLVIPGRLGWSPWLSGASLAFWVRVDRGSAQARVIPNRKVPLSGGETKRRVSIQPNRKKSHVSVNSTLSDWGLSNDERANNACSSVKQMSIKKQLHFFSFGSKNLILECWVDVLTAAVNLRLTRVDPKKGYELVSEQTIDGGLTLATWHHVAVNITDFVKNKKTVIDVSWIVDGYKETKSQLPFTGLVMRKAYDMFLLLGHQATEIETKNSLSLANLFLFRSSIFTKAKAMALVAYGPNLTNLADCRVAKPFPNLSPYLTAESLISGFDWNSVLDDHKCGFRDLADSLLLTYSAHNPNTIVIYQGNPGVTASSLLFRPATVDLCGAQLPPVNASPKILAPLSCNKNETILPASYLLGGSSIFLYLFARVVELNASESDQASGLFLILRLVQSDANHYSQFVNYEHHKLLHKVFGSQLCKPSLYLLKAIFDACCNKPVIQIDSVNKLSVNTGSSAIIKNSLLLSTLINIWLDIAGSNVLLEAMLASLQTLISDRHPSREFNVAQLNRGGTMSLLLNFCKERLVSQNKATLGKNVCASIVELVRSLMGAPPEFSHIVKVMDTLMLLHPANATFITQLKNSFYPLLSAGQNYVSQAVPCQQEASHLSRQTTSMSLEKWVQVLKSSSHENDGYADPVDAGKLSKALTNLQMKSISGNSCPTPKDDDHEEIDSNRYSDDITLDSGISDTCRENLEQDNNIVKAVDGSQHNLGSFFPSINTNFDDKAESEQEEKCVKEVEQKENWDYLISEGFLLLLRDVILVLPDNMARQILGSVTKFKILLVMANHQNHAVRAAVVQLVSAYLKQANDDERNRFLKCHGFYHLANQIAMYPASQLLVEACLNLITPCVISLDDQSFIAQRTFSAAELDSIPPLLALLPRCVHNSSLTHQLINILRIIFCKSASCAKTLLEHGLVEVLVKALLASAHISYVSHQITSHDTVVSDLQSFFGSIATQFLNTPGVANMQIVCDIRLELHYISRVELDSCGATSHCAKIVRETHCQFIELCLDLLLEKVLALQTESHGQSSSTTPGINDTLVAPRSMTSSHSSVSLSNLGSQSGGKDLSKNELKERLGMIIPWCTQFLINEVVVENDRFLLGPIELDFVNRIFPKYLEMMTVTLEKRSYFPWKAARGVLFAVHGTLKSEVAELLVWLMCPRQPLQIRLLAITSLLSCSKASEVITALLQTDQQIENKFTVFLWDLMYSSGVSVADLRSCMELKENLKRWCILSPQALGNARDSWGTECNMLLSQMDRQKGNYLKQMESLTIRCITKYDHLLKIVAEEAVSMSRTAVNAQNKERKEQIAEIRQAMSNKVATAARWRALIGQLTHEGAIWCDKRALPRFWQLDPTEGPHRVRNRLMATHLPIGPKFLKPEHKYKSVTPEHPQPLSYLFEGHHDSCPSAIVIERLQSNEKIRSMVPARVITPAHEVPGELLIGESSLYFVADDKHLCSTLDAGSTAWPFEDVREVHQRRFQLQERAIELFLRTGRTYLIAFETCDEKMKFVAALKDCKLPNQTIVDSLVHYTNRWRDKQITNWEYLMQLNKIAGRSFNDLMQYPVFPFVLAEYATSVLDLTNLKTFRNLKKPMAVQEERNEQHYISKYNDILAGLNQVTLNREPYHYGSHYSNSGTVLHFLVRLPPFTTMLIKYQDGNFDLADRTFHNIETTWRLTSCDSTTDVKELIPEFYSLPEFLLNNQGFDFGARQNGDRVDDVILPTWCRRDARRFILVHRQALESDVVTEYLPHWIDLVFGFKQTGKAAVDAINVFNPATYCGFDVSNIQDLNERNAWETMVRTYGQTPRQLFQTHHPLVIQSLVAPITPIVSVLPEVKGLKWGSFVGSPIENEPRIAWKQTSKDNTVIASLLPLSTNDVYALPAATTCLIRYSKEKGLSLVNSTPIRVALVTSGHSDGLFRLKIKKDQPTEPLMFISHLNPVTACNSLPDSGQLWIGHQSGSVSVVKFSFKQDRYQLDFVPLPIQLQAHKSAITAIAMSGAFSIAVTASRDGFLKIWDLNNISYVRSIELGEQVVLAAISSTLGDIAAVTQTSESSVSKLNVYSINAAPLGSVTVHDGPITAVCFSSAKEGVSVNVVACGLANGIIRLWSTWDLKFVRDILNPAFQFPIISLTYSRDAQHLYAGCMDGTVIVWENSGDKYDSHPPKFLNLKTLL